MSGGRMIPPDTARPLKVLDAARGFSCLFWGMPVLAAGHALAMVAPWPAKWLSGGLLAAYLPILCGLWRVRRSGCGDSAWTRRVEGLLGTALAAAALAPFLPWWIQSPLQRYFAVNALLFLLVQLLLLVGTNRLAGAMGHRLGDRGLRREARAGIGMVIWLSGCSAAALAWLFYRAGLFEAGWPTVMMQLTQLPREARTLFLLPYAMTSYVMWRARETAFRQAKRELEPAAESSSAA